MSSRSKRSQVSRKDSSTSTEPKPQGNTTSGGEPREKPRDHARHLKGPKPAKPKKRETLTLARVAVSRWDALAFVARPREEIYTYIHVFICIHRYIHINAYIYKNNNTLLLTYLLFFNIIINNKTKEEDRTVNLLEDVERRNTTARRKKAS